MIVLMKCYVEELGDVNCVIYGKDGYYDFKSFGKGVCFILWFIGFYIIESEVVEN